MLSHPFSQVRLRSARATRRSTASTCALALLAIVSTSQACAQPGTLNAPKPKQPQRVYPPSKSPGPSDPRPRTSAPAATEPRSTTVQIDLLMSDATQALESQRWGRVFDAIGHRVRVRTEGIDDKPGVTETKRGTLRTVTVVARIDRRGTLTLPGKTFQASDEKAIKEWLETLEAYGAQGSPAGQPRWGLSTAQFQELFRSLGKDVEQDVKGLPLIDAARSLGFTTEIPLRIHDAAAVQWNAMNPQLLAMQDVKGLSRGSAFAILLNDHGLCIRPLRTPSGAIELVVHSRVDTTDPWPLGWEPRPDVPRSDYAPGLFNIIPIGFLNRPVLETLDDARTQTDCAIAVDLAGAARKEVDLSKKFYGLPQKKTAWTLVLNSALTGTGLVPHIRVDEAGRGFIYVAPFDSRSISGDQ